MPTISHPKQLTFLTLFLLLIGNIMLFSATGVMGLQKHNSEFYYVTRQLSTACVGLCLMFLLSRIPYNKWEKLSVVFILMQILLVGATRLPQFGHTANAATRWLKIGGFVFQPSELAKISVVLYFSFVLSQHKKSPIKPKKWIGRLAPLILLLGLILKQPDLGTTVLLCSIILGTLFVAGVRIIYFSGFISIALLGLVFSLTQHEYRRKRLFAFLNPWADPQGNGFQSIQSFLSFHSGGLFGSGIGNGNSKLFFLPEVHTDFIFALIGEELGFIGAGLLLFLVVYFSYLVFRVAYVAKDSFGCFVAFGLAMGLAFQFVINMGGVTGLLPVKGLTLPFISWGRSALIVNLASIGILLSILRNSAFSNLPKKKPANSPALELVS